MAVYVSDELAALMLEDLDRIDAAMEKFRAAIVVLAARPSVDGLAPVRPTREDPTGDQERAALDSDRGSAGGAVCE